MYLLFVRPLIPAMQTVCVTDRPTDKIRRETESLTWTMAASVLCSIKTFHEEHDLCEYSKFPARPARERDRERVSEDIGELRERKRFHGCVYPVFAFSVRPPSACSHFDSQVRALFLKKKTAVYLSLSSHR